MSGRPVPLDLRMVAWIFFLMGVDGTYTFVLDVIRHPIANHGSDGNAFCVPVYFGLVRLWPGFRKIALVFLALFAVVMTMVGAVVICQHLGGAFTFLGHRLLTVPSQFTPLYFGACFGLVVWEWRVLTRPDVVRLFSERAGDHEPTQLATQGLPCHPDAITGGPKA